MKVLDTDIIKIVSVTDDGKEVVSELSKKEWMNDWYGVILFARQIMTM